MVITDELLEKKKRNALEILRYFIGFCNKHGLRYYCAFGTAIGAVRHKGFIPWDDDIDVQMPRPDYEKLMGMRPEVENDDYELLELRFTPGYFAAFAKLSDRHTTLREYESQHVLLGNNIDIFPIDGISSDMGRYRKDYLLSQKYRKRLFSLSEIHDWKWVRLKLAQCHPLAILKYLEVCTGRTAKRERLLKRMRKLETAHPFGSTGMVANYYLWSSYDRLCMPEEWYGEGVTGSFEGMEVMLPAEYDKVLTRIYGDYMHFPPESERVSTHKCHYIDLDGRSSVGGTAVEGGAKA